ncbi:tetratricopeptide repeat protein [Butyrivibrio sp. YAB3001]|uniref:tetratricopeptide repeat protein n=1 Tax=Butyrivibrio sp. YAB3001 TaxID=1520812 RepID=UPI0008F64218|nr:tetratricopeptide repeat protein [Butyrivibrio sp. YAB3001]SFC27484.1 TPR repeat [Butyrivibrio sp. YAB3001]
MIEYNAELMSDKDLIEAANEVFSAQEKDFEKIKTEKWYKTFFHAITLNQDGKKYLVRGIKSLAKLQQLFMSVYVKNYRKSHEQLDAVIDAVTKNSNAIKNLYRMCVLDLEEQSALEQIDDYDGEILALFLGEYRNENGNVPSKVRDYNRGVLIALNQKIPSGSLENHQISKLKAPKVVYRCFMEQCAVDGTIDTQEWSDKIYQDIDDFELSNNTKLEIKESVKREVEIAGVDYLLVKYTKNNSGVLDTDFVIELEEKESIINHSVDDYDIKDAEQKLLDCKIIEALVMFNKLAESGNPRAMYHLEELYTHGSAVNLKDREKAIHWRKKGTALGDPLCKLNTAYTYKKNSDKRISIITEVINEVHFMANEGDLFAQNELSELYKNGEVVEKNEHIRLEWLKKSANGGCFRAIEKLGGYYINKNDIDTAIIWYKKGAEREDAASYHRLGDIYKDTKSLYKMAFDCYVRASELGDIYAPIEVGAFYDGEWGNGIVPMNYDEAFKWYNIGAERGDSEALVLLGTMYMEGHGTQINYESAMACFEKAYEEGESEAALWMGDIYNENKNFEEAIKWYEKAYEEGESEAAILVGHIYYENKNFEEAIKWFEIAYEAGAGEADVPYILGVLYEERNNLEEAIKWYKKGAERDDAASYHKLGDIYKDTKSLYKMAFDCYVRASELGDIYAPIEVGAFYDGEWGNGIVPVNYDEAFKWYNIGAERGDSEALVLLGIMYMEGHGTQINYESAMACFEKAYEEGNSGAALWMGDIYNKNNNFEEAIKWFEIAYEAGDAFAPNILGGIYEERNNIEEAIKWYKNGDERNNKRSQLQLGELFEMGKGVNKDLSLAFDYYLKAAMQGNKYAEYNVGRFYYCGLTGEKNINKAKEWLAASASQGVEEAKQLLEKIK